MNRRNFLKWFGATSLIAASPQVETITKEVEKVMKPPATIFNHPSFAVCVSGGIGFGGGGWKASYNDKGQFTGWETIT